MHKDYLYILNYLTIFITFTTFVTILLSKIILNRNKLIPSIKAFIKTYQKLINDIQPKRHLGSYVTVKSDVFSFALASKTLNRNIVIHDYSSIEEMSDYIINKLFILYHLDDTTKAFGTITVGSSEAVMLALLTYVYKFKKQGVRPNIIVPSTVHSCGSAIIN